MSSAKIMKSFAFRVISTVDDAVVDQDCERGCCRGEREQLPAVFPNGHSLKKSSD